MTPNDDNDRELLKPKRSPFTRKVEPPLEWEEVEPDVHRATVGDVTYEVHRRGSGWEWTRAGGDTVGSPANTGDWDSADEAKRLAQDWADQAAGS